MISKYQNNETLQEYRDKRRISRQAHKRRVQNALRQRDGYQCRWPGCDSWKRGIAVHAVHLDDMGMGGDKSLLRTQRHLMIRLCFEHHESPRGSIHSKDLRVVYLTDKGTDGPCDFQRRDPKGQDGWISDGMEDDFLLKAREVIEEEHTDGYDFD